MVEAVIALPLFVVVFVSVLYVRDLVLVRQSARAEARSCAWLYSAKSCAEIPPGCAGILGAPADAHTREEATLVRGVTDGLAGVPDPVGGAVKGLVKPAIVATFGRSVKATARHDVARPGLFAGGRNEISESYDLACNLAPSTVEQVASRCVDSLRFLGWFLEQAQRFARALLCGGTILILTGYGWLRVARAEVDERLRGFGAELASWPQRPARTVARDSCSSMGSSSVCSR